MNAVQKLRSLVNDIRAGKPALRENWELAARLLSRMEISADRLDQVITHQNVDALESIVHELEHPAAPSEPTGPGYSDAELDRAFKAFSKRLRVMRLADESRLGGRYTSGGRKSSIDAIRPPEEFPRQVWDALVHAGKLRAEGPGFYAPREESH